MSASAKTAAKTARAARTAPAHGTAAAARAAGDVAATPCAAGPDVTAAIAAMSPCNNIELRKATRHLGQLFDDIIGASGLRAAQQGLLFFIDSRDGPTMKEMAKAIVMDLSALGQTLKPLVRDGYVRLTPCSRDGRAKRVYLTAAGKAKAREGLELWRLAQGRVEAVLGAEKAQALREALAFISSDNFADAFTAAEPAPVRFDISADVFCGPAGETAPADSRPAPH